MFNWLKSDEHLRMLLWRFAIVLGAVALALIIGAVAQWLFYGKTNIVDDSLFTPSGVQIKEYTQEEKVQILDLLSHATSTVTTDETGEVVIAPEADNQSIAEKEKALEVLSSTEGDTGAQGGMTEQEKLDILNQL